MKRLAKLLCAVLCLAACGGGGGGGGGIDPRLARLDIYEAQKRRVLGDPGAGVPAMAITADENVPASGMMSFTGSGTMRVEAATVPLVLFGDARLQVDFDAGNASGAIENSFGTDAAGNIVDYTGTITLQSAAPTQNMALGYQGTLTSGDLSLGFAGTMNGIFLGNPTSALSAADLEADVTQNGTLRSATVVVTLEQTPPAE